MKAKDNEPKNPEPTPVEQPSEEVDLAAQNAELIADLQRTRADFENYRKQTELQREQARTLGAETTIMNLLPLLDDMARAFEAEPETLAPIKKSFDKALSDLNLEKIEASENTDFNPDLHEAISMDDSEGSREVIAEELRPGYIYNGNVIRAAMVRVKKID